MTVNELLYDKCTEGYHNEPKERKILKGLCDVVDLSNMEYDRLYNLHLIDIICELNYMFVNDSNNLSILFQNANSNGDAELLKRLSVLKDSIDSVYNYLQDKYSDDDVRTQGDLRF